MARTMHGLLLVVGAALIGGIAFFVLYTFVVPRFGLGPANPPEIAVLFALTYGAVGGVVVAFGFIDVHVSPDEFGPRILPYAVGAAIVGLVAWILIWEGKGTLLLRIQAVPIFTLVWVLGLGGIIRRIRSG